ncbi:hypothetical protein HZA33_05210 [Candidatus Pacearchaeota archaeon]|nr:hypothetical protein [Candidatus Pacearchaeota archaeon]
MNKLEDKLNTSWRQFKPQKATKARQIDWFVVAFYKECAETIQKTFSQLNLNNLEIKALQSKGYEYEILAEPGDYEIYARHYVRKNEFENEYLEEK